MRKIISIVLAIVLILALTGCGGSASASTPASGSSSSETRPANASDVTSSKASETTISETVIFDERGIKVTAKELNMKGTFGPELKLLIENDSGSDLTFQCRGASVNGYMVETMMSVDVANGKKANDSLTFSNSDIKLCGIDTIANLCFSLHIFDSNTWDTFIDTAEIELRTSNYEGYVFTYDDAGQVAYEGNGVKIVVKGVSSDSSWLGPSVIVFIQNDADRMITVQARNVSVNGFMVEPIFSSDVAAGKVAIDDLTLMNTDIEANGIESIDELELSFHVFYEDTWDDIVDTPSMVFSFG
jgi:hypothetical protein